MFGEEPVFAVRFAFLAVDVNRFVTFVGVEKESPAKNFEDGGHRVGGGAAELQDTGYRIRDTGYGIQDTGYALASGLDTGGRLRREYGILAATRLDTGYGMRDGVLLAEGKQEQSCGYGKKDFESHKGLAAFVAADEAGDFAGAGYVSLTQISSKVLAFGKIVFYDVE